MKQTLNLRPLALSVLYTISWHASAQEAISAPEAPEHVGEIAPVLVTGKNLGPTYTVESISVGSKTSTTPKETPHSISVMTRDRIEMQNLTSLDEVMAQTPGITVDQSGTGVIPAYYSRGYPIEYFQYDAVPIQTGGASWSQPDMLMFEQVELLRGAGGLFNGAGQPGGVLNLVRKRPGRMPAASGMLGIGSWNNRRIEIDLGTPFNNGGRVRGRVAAAYDERESFIRYVSAERTSLYGIIEADMSSRTRVSIGAGYQERDWTPPFGGVPRYTNGSDLKLPRSTFLSTPWTFWDFETKHLFAELNHAVGQEWILKISTVHDHESSNLKYGYTRGAVDPQTLTGPVLAGGANAYDNQQWAIDAYLTGVFQMFGRRHELVAGANWYDRESESWNGRLPGFGGTLVNVFAPNPSAMADPGDPVWFSKFLTNTRQHGLYGTLRLKLTAPLTLILGGRISWWETTSRNLLTTAVSSDYDENRHFIPYLGMIYALNPRWSLYASHADIFRVQSNLLDTDANRLPPVSGVNDEVGVKAELQDGKLNLALSIFRIEETDRAVQISDIVIGGCCYATNGKVRSQGVETEISGQILPDWQLGAGYTFNTSRYLTDPVNQGQPFRSASPKHMLRLWTTYQLPGKWEAWSAGGGINVQSRVYTEGGLPLVRVQQGGYALLNLRVGYRFHENWSAAINLNNVLDRIFYTRTGSPGFGPSTMGNVYGEPRNVMLTLRARY